MALDEWVPTSYLKHKLQEKFFGAYLLIGEKSGMNKVARLEGQYKKSLLNIQSDILKYRIRLLEKYLAEITEIQISCRETFQSLPPEKQKNEMQKLQYKTASDTFQYLEIDKTGVRTWINELLVELKNNERQLTELSPGSQGIDSFKRP